MDHGLLAGKRGPLVSFSSPACNIFWVALCILVFPRTPTKGVELMSGELASWSPHEWHGEGQFHRECEGRTGNTCLSISSETGADFSWETFVDVKPFSRYRLSGWIRTQDVALSSGKGALFNVHGLDIRTEAVTGNQNWTRLEVVFETEDQDTLHINCLFGGWGLATGKAWFDDVRLEFLESQDISPKIVVNGNQVGDPISLYIYGQFIEHLGRCIYGGIWAEILEDRKFFYPVGAAGSPWKLVGQHDRVSMSTDNPYVGDHCPVIHPQKKSPWNGIYQGRLALLKDQEYEGRIVLSGSTSGQLAEVWLCWNDPGEDQSVDPKTGQKLELNLEPGFTTYPLRFRSAESTSNGRFVLRIKDGGTVRVGPVSLMPKDHVHGMRRDTLELLRQLNSPIYRWPGGNFVSGYDWRDGVGERDKRPPRKNPAWLGVEHNDFGLDEFMLFCQELETEPLVVVNSGEGDLEMACQELEYALGDVNMPMGRLRADHGHTSPYSVTWWGIGNEMYGNWQLGHMPLDQYVQKHNQFAEAMKKQWPGIRLVAVGATGPWSETMLKECADHMDLLSEHFYVGHKQGTLSHVRQMPQAVLHKAVSHRKYHEELEALRHRKIPIALDEWNYWYGPHLYGELGVRYYLKDALGVAAGIHEMTRHSDVFFMANYAQTVNVIGAIKTTPTEAFFDSTGLVLKLYRQHYGLYPIQISGEMGLLDVAAAWSEDRKSLTVGLVNPTDTSYDMPVEWNDISITGKGYRWILTGQNAMSFNAPGQIDGVYILEERVSDSKKTLYVPPLSVVLYKLETL